MRWLRPTVPHDTPDEAVEDVAEQLHRAASEAPPAHRAEEIRAALLEEVGIDRPLVPGLTPLALAAGALLLALAIGVGAPAVGSFIGDLLDRPLPSDEVPADPDVTDASDIDEIPMPSDAAIPARERPSPPVVPANAGGGVVDDAGSAAGSDEQPATFPAATPSPAPATSAPTSPPSSPAPLEAPWPPSGPPDPMPTPPASGPPSAAPGG